MYLFFFTSGNFVGQRPYKQGESCTQCGNGKFYCKEVDERGGLCGKNDTYSYTRCNESLLANQTSKKK